MSHATSKSRPLPPQTDAVAKSLIFLGQSVLEQLFEQSIDTLLAIKDIGGRYVSVNQVMLKRLGMSNKSQLIGRHVSEIYPEHLAAIYAAQDDLVLHAGKAIVNHLELDWYMNRRLGWFMCTKLPIRDESGVIIGMVGVSRTLRNPGDTVAIPAGLGATLEYLEVHLDEPLSPKSLAQQAGLSPARFARLVKRIYGVTPSQLIVQTRLSAATNLLRATNYSISEIAVTCGFYDHSALTRTFHSATGFTPSQFRAFEKR